jgi:putative PIN family toxin of toxin-antitoxin system
VTRVVIDTSTLVPGFLRAHGESPAVRLFDAWIDGAFTLVLSEHILEELQRTFRNSYFARRLTREQGTDNIALLRSLAVITPLTAMVSGVATHHGDDLVLATALSGNAEFLVTADYKLMNLKQYRGVSLVTAHQFLAMLPGLMAEGN